MRLDFDVRPSNPPAPLLQATFFDDTLRKPFLIFPCGETTCVWIFDVRPSNPPAPLLQATFFDDTLRIFLTFPQIRLRRCCRLRFLMIP